MRNLVRLTVLASVATLVAVSIPATAPAALTCFGQEPTILGTSGPDDLIGGSGADVIMGQDGGDLIVGDNGNDRLCGGPGWDDVFPGLGNDRVNGGDDGENAIFFLDATGPVHLNLANGTAEGGEGDDIISGFDNAYGGDYDDHLVGNAGSNLIFGNTGHDTIIGGADSDWFLGEAGDDDLFGGDGFDYASFAYAPGPVTANLSDLGPGKGTATGEGNDTLNDMEGLIGSTGSDVLIGGPGTNAFVGDPLQDTLAPSLPETHVAQQAGPAPLAPAYGDDDIFGKRGWDVQFYMFSPGPISAYLDYTDTITEGSRPRGGGGGGYVYGGEGSDYLESNEIIVGTDFNDYMLGDKKSNGFFGGPGDDELLGKGKGDYLDGEAGDDLSNGGGGKDACYAETKQKCETKESQADLDDEVSKSARAFRKH